jgi:hypothetical protein
VIRRDRPPTLVEQAPTALDELHTYAQRRAGLKTQRHCPSTATSPAPDSVERLVRVFEAKCAYCESPAPEPIVDWLWPSKDTMRLDGTVDRDHYWWLVYESANL